MSVLAQGTELYALVPTEADATVFEALKLVCPTSINLGEDSTDEIDATCLDESTRKTLPGVETPGTVSVPIYPDPSIPEHKRFFNLQRKTLKWALGWSDGTGIEPGVKAPVGYEGYDFDLPATRTWCLFEGYIENFPFDFQTNTLVTANVTIKRSGATQWIVKTENASGGGGGGNDPTDPTDPVTP